MNDKPVMTDRVKHYLEIAGVLAIVLVSYSFWAAHDDNVQMKARIEAGEAMIANLEKTQATRSKQADTDRKQVDQQRAAAKTPPQQAELLNQLAAMAGKPQIITVPVPVPGVAAPPNAPSATMTKTQLADATDLAAACRKSFIDKGELEGKLDTCNAKLQTRTDERDSAVKAAKGGGWFKRLKSASKWLGIGAAAGATAAIALTHR